MIMIEDLRAMSAVIVEILDDVRIVQIDRRRDVCCVCEVVVRDVTLNDCGSALVARARNRFG